LARLSGPARFLSDDGICLRRTAEGIRIFATPFVQQDVEPFFKKRSGELSAPLEGLYFLKKGEDHGIEQKPRPQALGEILHNLTHFFRWFPEQACRQAFSISSDIVMSAGPKVLRFSKDAGFWDAIIQAGNRADSTTD
jgi:hypothetical protein